MANQTNGNGYGILSPIAQNAIRDMMLRPDVYAQAEEELKVLLADIITEVENGMDMNTAIKAAYEKIYQSVNPSFNYDKQFSLDTCYRDIPAVDMAMFTVARSCLMMHRAHIFKNNSKHSKREMPYLPFSNAALQILYSKLNSSFPQSFNNSANSFLN